MSLNCGRNAEHPRTAILSIQSHFFIIRLSDLGEHIEGGNIQTLYTLWLCNVHYVTLHGYFLFQSVFASNLFKQTHPSHQTHKYYPSSQDQDWKYQLRADKSWILSPTHCIAILQNIHDSLKHSLKWDLFAFWKIQQRSSKKRSSNLITLTPGGHFQIQQNLMCVGENCCFVTEPHQLLNFLFSQMTAWILRFNL